MSSQEKSVCTTDDLT